MKWNEITRLRDAMGSYLHAFGWITKPDMLDHVDEATMTAAADKLHAVVREFMAEESIIDTIVDGNVVIYSQLDTNDDSLLKNPELMDRVKGLPNVVDMLNTLVRLCEHHLPAMLDYDTSAMELEQFAKSAYGHFKEEINRVEDAIKTLPSDDDVRDADIIMKWRDGKLGNIDLFTVMCRYVYRDDLKNIDACAASVKNNRIIRALRHNLDLNSFSELWSELKKVVEQLPGVVEHQSSAMCPLFPDELEPTRKVFECLVEKGVVERDGNCYHWRLSAVLYGFFVDAMNYCLGLHKKALRNGSHDHNWEPFEMAITNGKKLRNAANNWGRVSSHVAAPKGATSVAEAMGEAGLSIDDFLKERDIYLND